MSGIMVNLPDGTNRTIIFYISGFLAVFILYFVIYYEPQNYHDILRGPGILNYSSNGRLRNYTFSRTNTSDADQVQSRRILILVYTVFFSLKHWIEEPNECVHCSAEDFELTYDKQLFTKSDLVVFHARNMPSLQHLKSLLNTRPASQRWLYALWESPNVTPNPEPLNGLFNLTWSYRSDSSIWGPYGWYEKLSQEDINMKLNGGYVDYAQNKTELVAWVVGNCNAQLRISVVHKMKKYIKVDVYGACGRAFGESRSCPRSANHISKCVKNYKFYLSFENALCEDYVTEKYWRNLGDGNVVPIVMGGANYTKLAIPGSYINVMDFKTVKELVEYLQYLDKNNTAYNEYFNWRLKYKVHGYPSRSLCDLCRAFDADAPKKTVYDNLADYWTGQGKCNLKNQIVQNIIDVI